MAQDGCTTKLFQCGGVVGMGLILNGPPHADNPATLEQFGGAPVLGHLPPLQPLTAEALEHEWELQNLSDVIRTALEKLH